MLALLALLMAASSVATALLHARWPAVLVVAVLFVFGASAVGWNALMRRATRGSRITKPVSTRRIFGFSISFLEEMWARNLGNVDAEFAKGGKAVGICGKDANLMIAKQITEMPDPESNIMKAVDIAAVRPDVDSTLLLVSAAGAGGHGRTGAAA